MSHYDGFVTFSKTRDPRLEIKDGGPFDNISYTGILKWRLHLILYCFKKEFWAQCTCACEIFLSVNKR